MKTRTLFFTAPHQVEIREGQLPDLPADQMLVQTICSAISPGTEMLVYRGEFPTHIPIDDNFQGMATMFSYPLAYGYATTGRVLQIGKEVDSAWLGKGVFAFQPHTSHFLASPATLYQIPDSMSPETACFLPNMETAVNLVQDAAPLLGEHVLVFGQGIIGLLTTALLREFPLASLVTVDRHARRRSASLELGATACLDPAEPAFLEHIRQAMPAGADLTLELSGAPETLNDAILLTRFAGRVVIGSWYGQKRAALDLGGVFHRSRINLLSSQVSSIAPGLSGCWDKARRLEQAWAALERIRPEKWITHRFGLQDAAKAYAMLDKKAQDTIQILFNYT
jgi:2-desacetyl-2-hydroxyethyl bacteriochlorophyllide A dehydrogenase